MATPVQSTSSGRLSLWGPVTPLERGQRALLLAITILTVGAWALTISQARMIDMPMGIVASGTDREAMGEPEAMRGMAVAGAADIAAVGMAGAGWSLDGLVAFVAAWSVMMAAMMFPAAAPMLLLFRRVSTQRQAAGGAFVPTWVFATGYFLVWSAVGAGTWILVRLVSDLVSRLHPTDRVTWAPPALGAVLVLAGLYQLSPLKRVCLNQCRTPLGFVMTHWRDGHLGTLRMGVIHGAYCLGCCWALFATLVAAGVMSLTWMLVLTLVVFAEKVLPNHRRVSAGIGVAFALLGLLIASGAMAMPGML